MPQTLLLSEGFRHQFVKFLFYLYTLRPIQDSAVSPAYSEKMATAITTGSSTGEAPVPAVSHPAFQALALSLILLSQSWYLGLLNR